MANVNLKLEIGLGLRINMVSRELLWPTLIGLFSVLGPKLFDIFQSCERGLSNPAHFSFLNVGDYPYIPSLEDKRIFHTFHIQL